MIDCASRLNHLLLHILWTYTRGHLLQSWITLDILHFLFHLNFLLATTSTSLHWLIMIPTNCHMTQIFLRPWSVALFSFMKLSIAWCPCLGSRFCGAVDTNIAVGVIVMGLIDSWLILFSSSTWPFGWLILVQFRFKSTPLSIFIFSFLSSTLDFLFFIL